ncbi:TIGR03790 family protein [Geoalkalibacter halelectricus]|uniref:TIGR03790 family protein n=1 Tax=Geoalkalibacter halelectricus TaxID=2847045 RepID=UPI003D1EF705
MIRLILFTLFLVLPVTAHALAPAEVVVVANRFVEGSVPLARYYMEQRGIPAENLVRVRTTDQETVSRRDYDREIAGPLRSYLEKRGTDQPVRALVLMWGMPLRVSAPPLTREQEREKTQLETERDALRQEREQLREEPVEGEEKARRDARLGQIRTRLEAINESLRVMSPGWNSASVDSELSLVLAGEYPLAGMIPNPYFYGNRAKQAEMPVAREKVLWVSRLDAATPEIVRRVIDDTLYAEQHGLSGKAYFDARWSKPTNPNVSGYAFYDQSLHLAAEWVRQKTRMPVIVEDTERLFQPGEAPDTALYAGWYSLARYVDAFTWNRGAVGFHMASQECQSLRGGQYWCKRMLDEGVAVTIGPVGEPYIQAFPVPEIFFGLLVEGSYSLAECYMMSLPWLSWKMVMVGDPLYRPFGGEGRSE